MPLIKTEDRLSRNLAAPALDIHLLQRLAEMGSQRVSSRTVLCLDLSDVRKEYAQMRFAAQVVHFQDGQEKIYQLHYGPEPIWLPGRKEKLLPVVVVGFGQKPLMLITNFVARVRDSESLWWIVQIYLTRWKIEETFRFLKQSYNGCSPLSWSDALRASCCKLTRFATLGQFFARDYNNLPVRQHLRQAALGWGIRKQLPPPLICISTEHNVCN